MRRSHHLGSLAIGIVLLTPAISSGQTYQASILNPAGYLEAFAQGAANGKQVGFGRPGVGTNTHALLWSGSPAGFVDLNPDGYDASFAYGAGGGQQVGVGFDLGIDRAILWTGTAESFIDLSPADTTASFAYATDGTRQVGYARAPLTGVGPRAYTWTGTAASAVSLHSFDYDDTTAYDVDQERIVGVATSFDGFYNAVLWTSPTATSIVSLHRPADFDETVAYAIRGTTIAGNGNGPSTGGPNHAILWLDLGATVVDLHPGSSYFTSFVYAMSSTQQVGLASVGDGSEEHACVWSGTAASFVDLHALIPGGPYESSQATGIDSDGSIYGNARIGETYFAVRWTPVPVSVSCSPSDIAYGDGEPLPPIGQPGGFNPEGPDGGDFDCFFNFYFVAAPDNAVCDIAYGDGEPLPPYGVPGGFNPGVDGGDFDCFFNYYFNGCL